jgi:hypothetical protein
MLLPESKNTGQNLFPSKLLHQFHALVSLPSIQLPASKKLSAPDPSKAWRKKSESISRVSASPFAAVLEGSEEKDATYAWSAGDEAFDDEDAKTGICANARHIGKRMRYTCVYLSMKRRALGTL